MQTDRYYWRAKYEDGTSLSQADPSGIRNGYADIDRDRLSAFEIWEGTIRILYIRFRRGQRLIWRRRVEMTQGGATEVCHLIGKQETIGGKNYQGIIGLFESDGRVEATGKFEENHPWFFPVNIHPQEGEAWSQ